MGNSTCAYSFDLESIYNGGDNIAVSDENGILSSGKIGEFEGCFCVKPNNRRISLVLENKKNKVHIYNESLY